ncbi:MAG: hypothetical protein ACRD44_07160 [Bryobacteraceae bacterium]
MLDPFGYKLPLPYHAVLHPLGFVARLRTNSRGVLRAAEESWAGYKPAFASPPIELNVVVEGDVPALPPPPRFQAHGSLMTVVSDDVHFAAASLDDGVTFCRLSERAAADRAWTRYHFLDAIVYTILTHQRLTAVHAACVARGGAALLLFGAAGAGKTTLSYACLRAGWTFLSDDATYLLHDATGNQVIGKPHQLRFLPDAGRLFPELGDRPITIDSLGQPRIEIVPERGTAERATVSSLLFLERAAGAGPAFRPIAKEDAYRRILDGMPLYAPKVVERHQASVRRLAELECLEFRYDSLDAAVAALNAKEIGTNTEYAATIPV